MAYLNSYFIMNIFFISSILFLFNNPFLCFSREINSFHASPQKNHLPPSPLIILDNLIGARKGDTTKGISELKKHLLDLGYMESTYNTNDQNNILLFDDNLELALKKYQSFFKLQINGVLDPQTVAHLKLPRCGFPDISRNSTHDPKTLPSLYRFFPNAPRWPPSKRHLTYSFYPGTRDDVKEPILRATNDWASVTDFTFEYISNYDQADIKIGFAVLDHGDGASFDGPGGILAHAFPPTDGRLHFDGAEQWYDGVMPNAFDLQSVGLHELGHILGLGHSEDMGAAMFPGIRPGTRKGLGQDDIVGIHALYGG